MAAWLSILAAVLSIVLLILKRRRESAIPGKISEAQGLEKEAQERARAQEQGIKDHRLDDVANKLRDTLDDIDAIIRLSEKNPPDGGQNH